MGTLSTRRVLAFHAMLEHRVLHLVKLWGQISDIDRGSEPEVKRLEQRRVFDLIKLGGLVRRRK